MGRARVRTQYIIILYYYFLITHNNNTQNVYTNTHTNALRLKSTIEYYYATRTLLLLV